MSNKTKKEKTLHANELVGVTHLHIYVTVCRRYLIFSDSEAWDWDAFLDHGLHCENLLRFVEIHRDSLGYERVIKDVTGA